MGLLCLILFGWWVDLICVLLLFDQAKYEGTRTSIQIQAGFSRSQPIYAAPEISIEFQASVKMIVFGVASLGVSQ